MARRRTIPDNSPEGMFIAGGPEMEAFHPQPGVDPEHDAKHQVAYDTAMASYDSLVASGVSPEEIAANLSVQKPGVERVRQAVPESDKIEAERRRIAAAFGQAQADKPIDPKV